MLNFPAAARSWQFRLGGSIVAVGLICTLVVVLPLHGQPGGRNRLSPHETATSVVDGATIDITYGRPSMRGRKIFGALVPFDNWWMPGADDASIVRTSAPLQFGEFTLPAGAYSLYTIPAVKQWTLIINKMTGQFHTSYPKDQDLVRIPVTPERLPAPVEQLTISAVRRPQGGGELRLEWEMTRVSTPFVVVR